MVCIPDGYTYGGIDLPDFPWQNWAGTVQQWLRHWFSPASLTDLVDVVRRATADGVEVHAVGSGWAFEDVAVSADWVVSLGALTRSLTYVTGSALTDTWRAAQADPNGRDRLFHVEAGITIGRLNQVLADAGLAMPTLGGANGQSLAGAISTSTHGGDIRLPPLPDVVQAVHLVTVGGQEVWIERASEPITTDERLRPVLPCADTRILRDDDLLHAAIVAGGRFGVIYSLVLKVVPAFRLAEYTVERPTAAVVSDLRSGIVAGTGLAPMLAALADPPADLGTQVGRRVHYLEVTMASADPSSCWVRRRWPTTVAEDLHATLGTNPLCGTGMAQLVLITAAAALEAEALHLALIPFVGVVWSAEVALRAGVLRSRVGENLTTGEATALAVNAAWQSGLGAIVPHLNRMIVGARFKDTSTTGRRGPSHLIMTGTPEENVDCYRARSVEVQFPATTGAYLDFLERVMPVGPTFRQAGYISLRYSAPSRALISMHNLPAPVVVSIEISSLGGLEGSRDWVEFAERAAVALGGRPHWGQEHHLTGAEVEQFYGEALERWREALRSVSGTARTFSNAFTRRCGLEPAPLPRNATVRRVRVDRFPLEGDPSGRPETSQVFEPGQLTALAVDFGDLELGDSRLCDVDVENAGASPLQVGAVELGGAVPPPDLRIEVPTALAATRESAEIALLYAPSRPGPVTGTLTVRTNAPATPELRIALRGTAHGQQMAVDQRDMDFGSVQVGDTTSQVLRLRNTGDREGTLIGAVVVGGDDQPTDFRVAPESATVPPGGSVPLTVSYTPTRSGPAQAQLQLRTRRGSAPLQTLEANLTAGGLEPMIVVTPTSLAFPVVPVRRVSPWQGVEVANRGTGLLQIAGITGDPEVEYAAFCPPALNPGLSCTVLVRFRPAGGGDRTGAVSVRSNAPGSPHTVACTGTGVAAPLLLLDPAGLDLDPQPVGTTGGTQTVWLTNDGVADLHIASVTTGGADPGDFAVEPSSTYTGSTLPPEGRCAVVVRFAPTAAGARSAVLRLDSDAYGSPHTVPLTGLGVPAPPLTVTPTALEFGPRPAGARSGARTVTVTNHGQAPMELATVTTTGADTADFAVVGGTCRAQPVLAVGGQCTIEVEHTPGAVGRRTGELRIATASGESATVTLDGTGTGPVLVFEPPETDFGLWAVGGPTPDLREVRVRNLGNVPVRIARVDVEGDFPNRDGCAGNVIAPGGECTVRLRFLAQAEGPRIGRIVVTDGDGRTYTALLRGTGGAPHIAIEPVALSFGNVPEGTGVERTLTVTNTGTWPLTIHDPQLLGPHRDDFTLVVDCDGSVLRAGEQCTMRMSFSPSAVGARHATLRWTSNSDTTPHEVSVEGTGIP